MKFCFKCKKEKPFSQFGKKSASKDGLQPWCRMCNRENSRKYYKEHGDHIRKSIYATRSLRLKEIRRWVNEYLLKMGCKDCGYKENQAALEFDHRHPGDKRKNISNLVNEGYSLAIIKGEIAKCDVRCANCHRIRTAGQYGWYANVESALPAELRPSRRAKDQLDEIE